MNIRTTIRPVSFLVIHLILVRFLHRTRTTINHRIQVTYLLQVVVTMVILHRTTMAGGHPQSWMLTWKMYNHQTIKDHHLSFLHRVRRDLHIRRRLRRRL